MWEAIESNRWRSWLLGAGMGALLVVLGSSAGLVLDAERGALLGALAALGVWTVLLVLALAGGDRVLLAAAGARRIAKDDAPRLWNVVEEMSLAAGLPRMPDVYVVDDPRPNAFAVGRRADQAAVAVTSGLLVTLTRDELQGVVAHEVAHIVNRDVLFLTLAGVLVGAVVIVSDIFLRALWYGGGRRRAPAARAGSPWLLVGVVGLALLAPLFARLLYFACSRRREYLADASGALYTRYPEGLATALEKIAARAGSTREVSRALAPLYIVNPLESFVSPGLFSTHPPTETRIRILRSMAGGAAYADYERAYRQVHGTRGHLIGLRTLAGSARRVPVRDPAPEPEDASAAGRARDVADLLGRLSDMLPVLCPCGVRIKLPAGARHETVRCPRCGRENIPAAARPGAPAAGSREAAAEAPLSYERRGGGWESFQCACNRVIHLSPSHLAPVVRCRGCGRLIEIAARAAEPVA